MACPTNRRFLLDQKKYENIKNSEKDQIENETKPPEKHPFGTEKRDEEHQVGNDKPLEENPSKNDGKDEKYLSDLHEVVVSSFSCPPFSCIGVRHYTKLTHMHTHRIL